jgi:aminomuconate-semialdehyde/2-hydroxymuconate-6-semialdehyde dehydrogenase
MNILNYINGKHVPPCSGRYLDNVNPSTGKIYGRLPDSDATDVELAVSAAQTAFPAWSRLPAEKRFALLNAIADRIDADAEQLALAETTDNGKPLWLSKRMDIPRAAANFRFFATGALHFASESHASEDDGINFTLRKPIGTVGCISPWNLPLYLFTWKIAPALAAGNCVVAKPSEVTPATAFLLSEICMKAGLPEGVLNIVHGTGPTCGEAIVQHPHIKAISFTGSTAAGSRIASIAAPRFKKLSLELGGKNPGIIFADCDWTKMLNETIRSSFTNQGQICLCTSRLLIEASVYEQFKNEFVARVKTLSVGDPLNDSNKQGAIVSKAHFEKIMGCISLAKEEGGRLLTGGNAIKPEGPCTEGYFIEPTVFEGPGPDSRTNREEIFGPVVSLQPFGSIEEAIELANASSYGLAATVWTGNMGTANRVAHALQSGIVWINCWLNRDLRTPFGGVNHSGVGREGGWEAFRFFTEPKNVCIPGQ